TQVRALISDDPTMVGADARTVIGTVLERDWRIVHIAGHGALAEGNRSGGVVLSADDTFLGPREIESMRVVPELVFVNCCHLAARDIGELLRGDGGLARIDRP